MKTQINIYLSMIKGSHVTIFILANQLSLFAHLGSVCCITLKLNVQ